MSLSDIGSEQIGLIEDVFMYRLVWALEAVRVRRQSLGWEPEDGTIARAAAACVDTGLPDYRMTLLVRGSLGSREAAQKVVNELDPEFFNGGGMRRWLASDEVEELSLGENWPSESAVSLWRRFRREALSNKEREWRRTMESFEISQRHDPALRAGDLVRVEPDLDEGGTWLTAPDFRKVGWMDEVVEDLPGSMTYAEIDVTEREATVYRIGPET